MENNVIKDTEKLVPKFFDAKLAEELYGFYLKSKSEKNALQRIEYKEKVEAEYQALNTSIKDQMVKDIILAKENYKKEVEEIVNTRLTGLKNAKDNYEKLTNPTPKDKKEYSNIVKGVEIVAKRAKIKAEKSRNELIKNIKLREFDLHAEYCTLVLYATDKVSPIQSLKSKIIENDAGFNFKAYATDKKMWADLIPFYMLGFIILAYLIARNTLGYGGDFVSVINQCIFVAIVATGAVFIYSQGGFDMSLGNASLMCALIAGIAYQNTHNLVISLILSVLVGAGLGIINAIFATMLNLPVMVMTLTMMNIISAINEVIFGGDMFDLTGYAGAGMIKNPWIYAAILLLFFIFCYLVFNYTKVGRRNKFIGSNKVAAKFNGINLMRAGIISFAISGIGLGLCGFIFANSQSGFQFSADTVLSQVGLNVIIAIVFGGMTTSGGPKSKVTCAIFGAFFVVFLDEFFNALNVAYPVGDYKFMVKGIVFIVVSLANMWDTRTKNLAAGGSIQ